MGRKVGATEDLLISMVVYAVRKTGKTILLLDDIETICGSNIEESAAAVTGVESTLQNTGAHEPHLTARTRCLLLSLLEKVERAVGNQVLIVCTARSNWAKSVDRFTRTFVLSNPGADSRAQLFRSYAYKLLKANLDGLIMEDELSNLVECTSGLSYSELALYCRGALIEAKKNEASPLAFLESIKSQLQQAVPDSLKASASTDFVEMKVSTLRDFQKAGFARKQSSADAPVQNFLYGRTVESAWYELRRLVITPICHASALHKMMFHDGGPGGKTFAGGVLITGGPGSGKSTLAYQCAAHAALMNPSVKLLDVSCTSLIHKQVGSSEQAIHRLFQTAKAAAPCILLMDGIENVAAVRGNDNTTEGTMDRVLSTLLTEIDGVDSEQFSADNPACLAIIGITHNPAWVDPALLRPGRLERVIELGMPELDARRKIAERELAGIPIQGFGASKESAALFIAERTEGFSGAAVVGVCNDAKMRASRQIWEENVTDELTYAVTMQHLRDAVNSQKAGKGTTTHRIRE